MIRIDVTPNVTLAEVSEEFFSGRQGWCCAAQLDRGPGLELVRRDLVLAEAGTITAAGVIEPAPAASTSPWLYLA